jgi:hypothetical protein
MSMQDSTLKYSQRISSPDEHEERPGRSLWTTDHETILRWADRRGAVPATVPGTQNGDLTGVLRLKFSRGEANDLQPIPWDEWFRAFDERGLRFIYQEHTSAGSDSNFFRLENPVGDDG